MHRLTGFIAGLLLALGTLVAAEQPDIFVRALFADRVVVVIDGRQHLLRVGQRSPEGVRLVSADSESARFEFGDRMIDRRLDGRVHAPQKTASNLGEVKIWRSPRGMFQTTGSINGLPVQFLVDTGASSIAMNSAEARRLGIDYRVVGEETRVKTASGIEAAYAVTLDRVKVGEIQLHNVEGLVIDGPQPDRALLGMSFLGRLDMNNEGTVMTLRKKY